MINPNLNRMLKNINESLQAVVTANKQVEILSEKVAEVDTMAGCLVTAEEKITVAEQKVAELNNEVKTLQEQVITLKADNLELTTKITDLQKSVEVSKDELLR